MISCWLLDVCNFDFAQLPYFCYSLSYCSSVIRSITVLLLFAQLSYFCYLLSYRTSVICSFNVLCKYLFVVAKLAAEWFIFNNISLYSISFGYKPFFRLNQNLSVFTTLPLLINLIPSSVFSAFTISGFTFTNDMFSLPGFISASWQAKRPAKSESKSVFFRCLIVCDLF